MERLGSMVERCRVARADAGRVPRGRVDVNEVARERVQRVDGARGGARTASWNGRASRCARSADRGERLRQVLDNLLENAVEASPEGGDDTVETHVALPWVELRVRDEGPGLPPEQRERAFDRFWRSRDGEGSGLGLAIVRRLVEQDGGNVVLLEAPGHGVEAVVGLRAA